MPTLYQLYANYHKCLDVSNKRAKEQKECLNHGLPEPLFEIITGSLVVTFRKYRITEEILKELNERQRKAVEHLKTHKKITRSGYVRIIGCSERTAFRDLEELLKEKLIIRKGGGRQTYYELA